MLRPCKKVHCSRTGGLVSRKRILSGGSKGHPREDQSRVDVDCTRQKRHRIKQIPSKRTALAPPLMCERAQSEDSNIDQPRRAPEAGMAGIVFYIGRVDRSSKERARWACRTVASPYLNKTNRDLGSEPVNVVGIVAARIVGGAAAATVAVGAVFVALMLVETLSRPPHEIAKKPRPVD